jgi:hypothetical protein
MTEFTPPPHPDPGSQGSLTAPAALMHGFSVQPPDHPLPLHIPHRSREVAAADWRGFPAPIPDRWARMAALKGFLIDRRIRDRYHVALTCQTCGGQTASKVYTLMTAEPRCGACAERRIRDLAKAAGVEFLARDPEDHVYGWFRAPCGHDLRRQFELIERAAAGACGLRCETCHAAREAEEAEAQGWTLIGPDPSGDRNYRIYRHGCGQEQRIARANMQTGRLDCGGCGESWASKPSTIYLARIDLPASGLRVLKLGYSSNPKHRFRYQLGLPRDAEVALLRLLHMPTGHAACAAERRANTRLAKRYPDAVIPPAAYGEEINVVSEIYCPTLLPVLHKVLDGIEARMNRSRAEPSADPGSDAPDGGEGDEDDPDESSSGGPTSLPGNGTPPP